MSSFSCSSRLRCNNGFVSTRRTSRRAPLIMCVSFVLEETVERLSIPFGAEWFASLCDSFIRFKNETTEPWHDNVGGERLGIQANNDILIVSANKWIFFGTWHWVNEQEPRGGEKPLKSIVSMSSSSVKFSIILHLMRLEKSAFQAWNKSWERTVMQDILWAHSRNSKLLFPCPNRKP